MMGNGDYSYLLVAVEFDPSSEAVIDRAQRLRTLLGARLSLLHVLEHIPPAPDYMPLGFGGELPTTDDLGLEQELLESATRQLDLLGERFAVAQSDRLVRIGATGYTIDTVAAEIGADLVIIGSHGRHGFLGLFGSTAKSVLRDVQCDVLCVKLGEDKPV